MPSPRAILRVPRAATFALVRFVRTIVVLGFAAFALALLAVRFIVFPQIESYRDALAGVLTRELGHPVEIAALNTGWDGWNPKLVVEGFRVLDRARANPTPLLVLPKLEMIVSWTSVPLLELRLKELIIDGPRLAIRRHRSGVLRIAGLEFDPAEAAEDLPVGDWILRQREIVIRDALIVWDDDLRNAPQLVLDRVQFRLESSFGHHRFGLRGTPPSELAAPVDIRGDVQLDSMKDWQNARGKLFVRLDYADVAAWREWLPLPGQIASGTGALRVWVSFAGEEPSEVVADVELAEVKATLGANLPEIALAHLSGRLGTRKNGAQREITTKALAFTSLDGERLDPTNFTLTWREGQDDSVESGRIEFDRMQLGPLATLSAHLPLPDRIRADLARFAPRGTLTNGRLRWAGTANAPTSFVAAAEFTQLGLTAQDAFPGTTGLNGRVDATMEGGEVRFAGKHVTLELPRVLEGPIAFDSLQSVVKWERRDGATKVKVEHLEVANADVSGGASGTYRMLPNGPGEIEIVAHASRGDARQIHRYLPRVMGEPTRHWLAAALTSGTAVDARLKISGNLSDFPFAHGKGKLLFTTKAKGVTLAHTNGWPAIEAIDADVRIDGTRLAIDATRGRVHGVDIGKTRVEIPDVAAHPAVLRVDGEAEGPVAGFVEYVNASPVAARIGPLLRGAETIGSARLALKIGLPLGHPEDVKVVGDFAFAESQVRIVGVPLLTKLNGKLTFTEHDVRARDVAAEILGGPSNLAVTTIGGQTRVTGTGTFGMPALRRELVHANAYLDRVSGNIDWSMNVNVLASGALGWIFESNLKGVSVDLPPPIGKALGDELPLRIEGRDETTPRGTDFLLATYGRIAQLAAHRVPVEGGAAVDRALLSLGRSIERPEAARADRPGLWIRGELPVLSIDDWIALLPRGPANESGRPKPAPTFAGADLDVQQFDAMGTRFSDLKLRMRETPQGWTLDIDGPEIAGTAQWTAPGASAPNGRVMARLSRIAVPGRGSAASWRSADAKESDLRAEATPDNLWPEIDVAAEALYSKERNLGRLEFVAQPRGADWKVDKLVLANDGGRLEASGAWRVAGRVQQTKLDVVLDAPDSAALLARYGYAEGVKGAATRIEGQLAWNGAPHEFDFSTLNGTFKIRVGPGRFTKLDPGPGKLLGVLSLQALPRRVTLDYSDVFSDGFAFDEINGSVRIAGGVMSTSDLKLVGPAAKVDISGETDLAKETQRLVVRVQPSLSSSVSAGAALLFLANPLVGAAIGAGSLFAQTLLQDPVEKMFRYEYTVSGSWSDPVIAKNSGTGNSPPVAALPSASGDR